MRFKEVLYLVMLKWDLFGDKFRESWGFIFFSLVGYISKFCVKTLVIVLNK